MRPKEIYQKLDINAERVKYFKEKGVFAPENPPSANRRTNYTETDYKNLKFLVTLTKMGMTCGDIRKMQEDGCTLENAIIERKKYIEDDMEKKRNALSLLEILIEDKEEFETFHTDYYWNIIEERESKGDVFFSFEDLYGNLPLSFVRTVTCPYCNEELEVDLEDFETEVSSYDNENGMGVDMVYSFDSEDNIECPSCRMKYQVSGWIREYPIGAYDSEEIVVDELPDEI